MLSRRRFDVVEVGHPIWREIYDSLPADLRDVFFSPGFAKAAQAIYARHRVLCAVWHEGESVALYPFVLRRIADVIGEREIPYDPYDLTGLYGRSGILAHSMDATSLTAFHFAIASWARQRRVLCAFDRFHPMLQNEKWMPSTCEVQEVGIFVVADLSPPWEVVFKTFSSGQRSAISQSRRLGCQIQIGNDYASISAFDSIYRQTMIYRDAAEFYYFPWQFFRDMTQYLGHRMQIVLIEYEGRVVSACLLLLDGIFCHYYLAGTARDALKLRASQLAQMGAMQYAQQQGCCHYLMGGGLSRDDSLSRYKLSFAPDGALVSKIGFTVFDRYGLDALRDWMLEHHVPTCERLQFYDLGE